MAIHDEKAIDVVLQSACVQENGEGHPQQPLIPHNESADTNVPIAPDRRHIDLQYVNVLIDS